MIATEVRNFQSIEHVAFEIEGFTALVGRSNIGKSALVRAVKAALTGAPVSSCVRHGPACLRRTKKAKTCKCFSSVALKAEGFDLLWEKGDAINRYTFNGVVYDKAEKGTPEFLSPAFLPVKVADQQTLLQVADQFSAIFLLDQTGGTVADVLSDVARLDRVNVAMRFAEKDRKEAASTRKVREKDVADLQVKLDAFASLDDAVEQAREVENLLQGIETRTAAVELLDGFMAAGSAITSRIKALDVGVAVAVPDTAPITEQQNLLGRLDAWVSQHTGQTSAVERLQPIEAIEPLPKEPLQAAHGTFARLALWHGQLVGFRDFFAATKPVEALPVLASLGLIEAQNAFVRVQGLLARMQALEVTLRQLEAGWVVVLVEEKDAHDEVAALGVCPTCVRPLEADAASPCVA